MFLMEVPTDLCCCGVSLGEEGFSGQVCLGWRGSHLLCLLSHLHLFKILEALTQFFPDKLLFSLNFLVLSSAAVLQD